VAFLKISPGVLREKFVKYAVGILLYDAEHANSVTKNRKDYIL
jgi:hypothetical protein